ncbi:MAG: hypothetical protein WBM70_05400 [Sulfurovum sp.]|jgi:hypothetical protein|uniref:hypothetical protein n=1 Tax=Sulfurovum sp. TaxID=1969726 RepID=UPI003C723D8E
MNILDASILFSRAENVKTQLDYILGHEAISEKDRQVFAYMGRTLDKIYMSANTRKHRQDLQDFIVLNGDKIYKKYTELSNVVLKNDDSGLTSDDCYELKLDL